MLFCGKGREEGLEGVQGPRGRARRESAKSEGAQSQKAMADDGAAESQESLASLDEVDECLLGVKSEIQRGGDGGDDDDKLSSSGRGAAERGPGAERDAPTEERPRRRARLGGTINEPINADLLDLSVVRASAGQAGSGGQRHVIVIDSDEDSEMDEAASDEAAEAGALGAAAISGDARDGGERAAASSGASEAASPHEQEAEALSDGVEPAAPAPPADAAHQRGELMATLGMRGPAAG